MDYSDNHIKKLEALLEEKQSIVISIKNDFTKKTVINRIKSILKKLQK